MFLISSERRAVRKLWFLDILLYVVSWPWWTLVLLLFCTHSLAFIKNLFDANQEEDACFSCRFCKKLDEYLSFF